MDENGNRRVELDLDALEPESRYVKVSGKVIEVRPPKMGVLTALLKLTKRFDSLDQSNQDDVAAALDEIKTALLPIVPEIKDPTIDFSLNQLMGLFAFITEMAKPPESKILEENNITPTTDPKKGGQDSSEQQPIS